MSIINNIRSESSQPLLCLNAKVMIAAQELAETLSNRNYPSIGTIETLLGKNKYQIFNFQYIQFNWQGTKQTVEDMESLLQEQRSSILKENEHVGIGQVNEPKSGF